MDKHISNTVDIELVIEGYVFSVVFERKTILAIDPCWGVDADGNRGIEAVFVEGDIFEDVYVDSKLLTEYPKYFIEKAETSIRIWLSENKAEEIS